MFELVRQKEGEGEGKEEEEEEEREEGEGGRGEGGALCPQRGLATRAPTPAPQLGSLPPSRCPAPRCLGNPEL